MQLPRLNTASQGQALENHEQTREAAARAEAAAPHNAAAPAAAAAARAAAGTATAAQAATREGSSSSKSVTAPDDHHSRKRGSWRQLEVGPGTAAALRPEQQEQQPEGMERAAPPPAKRARSGLPVEAREREVAMPHSPPVSLSQPLLLQQLPACQQPPAARLAAWASDAAQTSKPSSLRTMTLPSGRAGTPQSLPCSAALGSLRATVLAGMAASAAAGLQGPGEAAVLSAKERLAAELPPPPSPTLDSEAIICLEAQRHLLQQQLTLLQQQLMAAPSQPPEARSGPAVEAAPRHVQAQHELHIAAGRSKEPPTEPIADCTAALLAALARRTQREEHWRQEHLQPAGIRGCQLASQPRQAWVAQAQYPVQQPASKAHRLAPQQAQRQAAEALPGWQQHRWASWHSPAMRCVCSLMLE